MLPVSGYSMQVMMTNIKWEILLIVSVYQSTNSNYRRHVEGDDQQSRDHSRGAEKSGEY